MDFTKLASSPAASSAPKGIKRHKRTIEQILPFLAGHEGFRLSWQQVVHDAVSSLWQAASLTEANRSNHRALESPNRSNFINGKCLQQRCAEPHKCGINKNTMLLVRSSSENGLRRAETPGPRIFKLATITGFKRISTG